MRVLQVINILTLGSPNGKGCFFPNGFVGKINNPSNYTALADGTMAFNANGQPKVASQVCLPSPTLLSAAHDGSLEGCRCMMRTPNLQPGVNVSLSKCNDLVVSVA